MKNKFRNLVAAIMISGLYFVPVFCSAQVNNSPVTDNTNVENPSKEEDKSQAEKEAEEELAKYTLSHLQKNSSEVIQTSIEMASDIHMELQYTTGYILRR